MPATLEIVCENDDRELDMIELHYGYDVPDDVMVADFQCPHSSHSDSLREFDR